MNLKIKKSESSVYEEILNKKNIYMIEKDVQYTNMYTKNIET